MPSFSSLNCPSKLEESSDTSCTGDRDSSASPIVPKKPRMIHWSALEGPLTAGFRKQREKAALRPKRQATAPALRTSQTNSSGNDMETSLPTHLTIIRPYHEANSLVHRAFDDINGNVEEATPALDVYDLKATRPVDAATYERLVLGDQAHAVAPVGYQNFDWAPANVVHAMDLREVQPLPISDRLEGPNDQFSPYLSPPIHGVASYGDLTKAGWPALKPVMPLGEIQSERHGAKHGDVYAGSRMRKHAARDERSRHTTSPPRTRHRTHSFSRGDRALKRRRSSSRTLRKDRSNSFREQYLETARKGGKLPNDIDCFAYVDDSDGDEQFTWSTFEQRSKRPEHAGPDPQAVADDLPAVYKRFHPQYKAKAAQNPEISHPTKFKLPVPALENRRKELSGSARVIMMESKSSVNTGRRPLFKPAPHNQSPAHATQGSKVIEILDAEEKKKQKADILKGLSGSGLGLVQRSRSKSHDEDLPLDEPGEHKSSLYRSTKLGNDMEATSSLPFTGLQPVQHDAEDWTSSPEGSPAPEAGPSKNTSTTEQFAAEKAAPDNNSVRALSPKKWTFKLSGRG